MKEAEQDTREKERERGEKRGEWNTVEWYWRRGGCCSGRVSARLLSGPWLVF